MFILFLRYILLAIFCSFDHTSNRHVNTILIRNIQGVLKENEYDPTITKRKCSYTVICVISSNLQIIGAARTYFKSKKSDYQREQSGKKASTAASSRKRQRRHNVSLPKVLWYRLYPYFIESSCSIKSTEPLKEH